MLGSYLALLRSRSFRGYMFGAASGLYGFMRVANDAA